MVFMVTMLIPCLYVYITCCRLIHKTDRHTCSVPCTVLFFFLVPNFSIDNAHPNISSLLSMYRWHMHMPTSGRVRKYRQRTEELKARVLLEVIMSLMNFLDNAQSGAIKSTCVASSNNDLSFYR
jgi:hypothetical protein